MPVGRGVAPDIPDCRWLAWDNRRYPSAEELDVGYNGYANLSTGYALDSGSPNSL